MVSIPACHAGDRGSIPRRVEYYFYILWNMDNILSLLVSEHSVKATEDIDATPLKVI